MWEWCADSWHTNYDDAPTDGSILFGQRGERTHIGCCVAARGTSALRLNNLGFRLVVFGAAWT
ncbi:MAG: hypothetical protein ABFS56_17750 [Pseudomonadota bacterium]